MKKIIAMLLALTMVLAFAGCAKTEAPATTAAPETTAAPATEAPTEAPETEAPATEAAEAAAMTHEEYMAAELDTEVTVETYVQATQSWWDGKITIYCQSPDGAYFAYNVACSEEDAAKLVPGTKVAITGFKGEWSGEVEIMDGTVTIPADGDTFVAEALDVTELLGTEELIAHQNERVAFTGMTVEACNDAGDAFQYNWDGSGAEGSDSDLYFNASVGGNTYTFVIEYYLCNAESEAYKAVQALKVGDVINMEGFLYWYEGAQPHITSVTVAE
ncbi:MAG: hypothetical protein Q4F17_00360 [Eubacteriales bacterium]|nr:hypothetical protein [Eubacteriales bacterium]